MYEQRSVNYRLLTCFGMSEFAEEWTALKNT